MLQRRTMLNRVLMLAAFALVAGQAQAGQIGITFDETQLNGDNNDPIQQFYNGGTTFTGIGPGPSLGVTFSLNARVFTTTTGLVGTFTTPGIAELSSDTALEGEPISFTMDVQGGFAGQIFFDYAAIDSAGEVQIYSGLDGEGTLLADVNLPVTSPQTGPGTFVADQIAFSGVANSVVFDGGNKQLAIDDLLLTSAPEPSALSLLAIGLACCIGASRWRQQA